MKYNKMNRFEKKANRQQKMKDALHGEGLYVYENNTRGDLDLPKPTASGKKSLKVGEQFQGDNYYMRLVPTMLRYIRCIVPAGQQQAVEQAAPAQPLNEGTTMSEKQLILNQPDRVTNKGKVEHVVNQPQQPLNEGQPTKSAPTPEVLINEDPMDGVEIILG
jgi:hypothetical protein